MLRVYQKDQQAKGRGRTALVKPSGEGYFAGGGNGMLPVAKRALIIGLLGPAIQGLGLMWTAFHLVFNHWSDTFGPRHLVYEPGTLLIIVGRPTVMRNS